MRDFSRTERVGDELRDAISGFLLRDAHDPMLQAVSVTAVDVTSCLSSAKVYWVLISAEQPSTRELRKAERALRRAAGFLRARLARELPLRTVPELNFYFDESIERGRRMETLLAELDENDSE